LEVISPGSWRRDRIEKRELYEQFKVKEFWLIDPETSGIDVLSLQGHAFQTMVSITGDVVAPSTLLPGFSVRFGQLLA
jgi:Uma2 family endonuclease